MNFQNTETYFEHMCRTCMCTSDGLSSIFDCASDNEEIRIQEMLNLINPQLCIQATDQLPKKICTCCVEKIINVHRFQQMCLYSDKRLRSLLLSRIEGDFDDSGSFPTQVHETAIRPSSTEPDPLRDGSMEGIKSYLKLELQDERCAITDENRQDEQISLNNTEIIRRVGEQNNIYKNPHSEALFISNHSDNEHADIFLKTKRRNLIEKRYACNQCSKRFTTSSHLKRHERNLHIASLDAVEIKKDNETVITLRKQAHKTVLSGQIRKEHNCEHCNKKFKKLYSLKRHTRIHKDLFLPTDIIAQKQHEIPRPYVCKYCKKAFQQSCTLKDHIRTHTGEQPFLCSECGRAFNSSSNMKQHLLRHTGVKRYECPDCPKKFPCLSDLASHKAVHKKIKPHVCDICGACFGKPYQLKKHKMYHNGEKPHKCDYCEMRFVCVDHMKRHMRTHTGEKPYKCKYCDRAFAQSNDLVKHLRSHLGENVYRCELCPRGFRLATELREHFPEHKNDHEQIKKHLNALTEEVKLKTNLNFELTEGDPRDDSEIK